MPVSRGLLAVLLHNFPTVEESYCANCQKCHVFMPLENPCTSGVSNCVLWVTSPELFKAYETGTVLGKPSYLWLIIWTKKKQGSRSTKLFKETQHILTTVITFYNMCLRTNCEQQQKVWPQWIKWYDLSGGGSRMQSPKARHCYFVLQSVRAVHQNYFYWLDASVRADMIRYKLRFSLNTTLTLFQLLSYMFRSYTRMIFRFIWKQYVKGNKTGNARIT